ncbi:dnaJsubfamily C member 2-like [Dorcoceras hygrometricum]|uniref:DnaJsubfamily C member 2-like n=1 Tax=Dorcoceras hygrometricum TaxID=472368 RepID=A0A2Z7CG06_9LAMI|nr:dnaJsubfamily C member 2-like [Dorcoceras hygrometricum]
MEFLDEYESRPRFLIQSKQLPQPLDSESIHCSSYIHKPSLFVSLSLSIAILYIAFRYIDLEPLKSILLWLSFSLLLGPFAPPSLTAGDIRVGLGPIIEDAPDLVVDTDEKVSRRSSKPTRKPCEDPVRFDGIFDKSAGVNGFGSSLDLDKKEGDSCQSLVEEKFEEGEWTNTDEDVLRKLMGKHPVGQPGRWEAIAKGFKGKRTVESVIVKAKEMGVKKATDQDSFDKFLKDRKPVDKRVLDEAGDGGVGVVHKNVQEGMKESGWSAGEDLALLNALKTFPKDAPLRWEKIAASLPDKTKSACMKRVTELKKDFRNSRTSTGQAS